VFRSELAIGDQPEGVYFDPPLSSDAEIDSFNAQMHSVNTTLPPATLQEAIHRVERKLQKVKWVLRYDFLENGHVNEVLDHMEFEAGKKSPGAIYLRAGCATNADVFKKFGRAGVRAALFARIKQLLSGSDPRYMSDAIRIFIKREMHSANKKEQRRWRLIWGISLIDQMIDRLLYTSVINAEISVCTEIPSKPGFSFKGGGTHRMVTKYSNGSKKWISFDAKSFDLSCPGWALEAARQINENLCVNPFGEDWETWKALSRARESAAQYGSFVFSNGVVCKKVVPCIQPSGRFTTISTNCKIVLLLRELDDIDEGRPFAMDNIVAMGDDTVQDGIDDPARFVANLKSKYQFQFTIESEQGEFAEQNFCSTQFKRLSTGTYVPVPLNWAKNTYELCHVEAKICKDPKTFAENRASALSSLCIEYAFHPRFTEIHRLLATLYPSEFRSESYYKQIVTGFEVAGSA